MRRRGAGTASTRGRAPSACEPKTSWGISLLEFEGAAPDHRAANHPRRPFARRQQRRRAFARRKLRVSSRGWPPGAPKTSDADASARLACGAASLPDRRRFAKPQPSEPSGERLASPPLANDGEHDFREELAFFVAPQRIHHAHDFLERNVGV